MNPTTFAALAVGTLFKFKSYGCVYVKLSRYEYQLCHTDFPHAKLPGMTYNLRERVGDEAIHAIVAAA